jgi:hypothetical protein
MSIDALQHHPIHPKITLKLLQKNPVTLHNSKQQQCSLSFDRLATQQTLESISGCKKKPLTTRFSQQQKAIQSRNRTERSQRKSDKEMEEGKMRAERSRVNGMKIMLMLANLVRLLVKLNGCNGCNLDTVRVEIELAGR